MTAFNNPSASSFYDVDMEEDLKANVTNVNKVENVEKHRENVQPQRHYDLSDPRERMLAQIEANSNREVFTTPYYGNKIFAKVMDQKTIFEPNIRVHVGPLILLSFIFITFTVALGMC